MHCCVFLHYEVWLRLFEITKYLNPSVITLPCGIICLRSFLNTTPSASTRAVFVNILKLTCNPYFVFLILRLSEVNTQNQTVNKLIFTPSKFDILF